MAMRFVAAILTLTFSLCWIQSQCQAQQSVESLVQRLDAQAAEITRLRERLDAQALGLGIVPVEGDDSCNSSMVDRVPLVMEREVAETCGDLPSSAGVHKLDYFVDYDRGFVIRAFEPSKNPFELKINGWIQFRYHAFARDVESWTDNASVTRPVRNRSAFDIERGRLVFRGHAVDSRLTYFLQLDGDTDGAHGVDFFDYWWGWQLRDRFQIQVGKRKVPGSRQWLLGARRMRFSDRPMANDFFRPGRTVGIFGVGQIGESMRYEVMLGNGHTTANLANSMTDNRLTIAGTQYIDPLGDFGGQIVDYQGECDPRVRLGHSFVYSPQTSDTLGEPLNETNFVRLSDGTRLTQTDALAPGVTVSEFDLFLYGLDFAAKANGWSVNAEAFARWIEDLQGDGPLPLRRLFQCGGYVEAGYFLIPRKLDVNGRYSHVHGEFGDAAEIAIGGNWYPLAKPTMKFSLDVTSFDGSPLQNTASDILVGDDGILVRTQFQAEF